MQTSYDNAKLVNLLESTLNPTLRKQAEDELSLVKPFSLSSPNHSVICKISKINFGLDPQYSWVQHQSFAAGNVRSSSNASTTSGGHLFEKFDQSILAGEKGGQAKRAHAILFERVGPLDH